MTPVPFFKKLPEGQILTTASGFPYMENYRNSVSLPDRKIVLCDIDGTLAFNETGRSYYVKGTDLFHLDTLNRSLAQILSCLSQAGHRIYCFSARENAPLGQTEEVDKEYVTYLMETYGEATGLTTTYDWLCKHFVTFDMLVLRCYQDHGQDATIKRKMFEDLIGLDRTDEVLVVFDDRDAVVELWRKYFKLPCHQVDYGDK